MALNFPNNPALNDVYIDTTSGFSYQWNGTVWISFSAASSSQIKVLDDISGSFTGIAFTFALTSSSASISPPNAQSLIINLGGVIQDPSDDYIVSGSNIIFSTAPNNGLSFSGVSLGPAIPVNTIPSGTVTGGSLTVAGILSTTNLFVSGISTFVGLATHTGTIFGSNLSLTGVATATEFDITGSSNTFNAGGLNVGIATATSFVGTLTGNATGLSGNPIISVSGINNTGVATLTDLRLSSIADKTTIVSGNIVSLVYNTGGGNVAICTNPSGPITLNVTGIPTDSSFDNRAISFAVIVNQGATAYGCTNVSLNGVAFGANATVGVKTHIAYVSGIVALGSTTGFDVFNFTGINTTGSASTTTNYKLLSNVSGGYRRY